MKHWNVRLIALVLCATTTVVGLAVVRLIEAHPTNATQSVSVTA